LANGVLRGQRGMGGGRSLLGSCGGGNGAIGALCVMAAARRQGKRVFNPICIKPGPMAKLAVCEARTGERSQWRQMKVEDWGLAGKMERKAWAVNH